MTDEMKYAKIAYVCPFQLGKDGSREPLLLLETYKQQPVTFNLAFFFIGLLPDLSYCINYRICPDGSADPLKSDASERLFRIEDRESIGGLLPASMEIPVTLEAPVESGFYKIEALLGSGENYPSSDLQRAIAFMEIRLKEQ